ncbi:MAG TPA: metal ABC transporter substrate-binding protein [Candidatus Nitrosopolaris sp.]|nr:metal ABC transporter substrate-binding protein [Candidatus Nitrosopolaris sp.]
MHVLRRLLVTLLVAIVGGPSMSHAADKLKVVATTADLAAVARAVGGDDVDVTALARPTEDPHFVDAKPSFIRIVNQADVLIEGGASLEAGWLPPILDSARNSKISAGSPGRVVAAQGITLLEVPTQLDRSMGDVHPQGNPHFMLDPVAAKTVARSIVTAFCAVDHTRCAGYQDALSRFDTAIDGKLLAWQATLAPFKGTKVVTYHKDFDYFAERFGLEVIDTLEPKPGIPPSPTHLTELIPKMRAEHARLILIEPYRERSNPDFVAQNTGARVLVLTAMPDGKDAPDYIALVDSDVRQLAAALGEKPARP